jgi:hypothetical protein
VFFGSVAKKPSADAYVAELSSKSVEDLTSARLKHSYDISNVCARKYSLLKNAMWFALPGLVCAFVTLLLT